MDTGLTLKPAASLAQTSDTRPDAAARKAVAATELNTGKTVTPASSAAATLSTDDQRVREIVLDPHSREVIYRALDVRARRVLRQVPEEVKLRLRAYTRPVRKDKERRRGLDTTA